MLFSNPAFVVTLRPFLDARCRPWRGHTTWSRLCSGSGTGLKWLVDCHLDVEVFVVVGFSKPVGTFEEVDVSRPCSIDLDKPGWYRWGIGEWTYDSAVEYRGCTNGGWVPTGPSAASLRKNGMARPVAEADTSWRRYGVGAWADAVARVADERCKSLMDRMRSATLPDASLSLGVGKTESTSLEVGCIAGKSTTGLLSKDSKVVTKPEFC